VTRGDDWSFGEMCADQKRAFYIRPTALFDCCRGTGNRTSVSVSVVSLPYSRLDSPTNSPPHSAQLSPALEPSPRSPRPGPSERRTVHSECPMRVRPCSNKAASSAQGIAGLPGRRVVRPSTSMGWRSPPTSLLGTPIREQGQAGRHAVPPERGPTPPDLLRARGLPDLRRGSSSQVRWPRAGHSGNPNWYTLAPPLIPL